MKTNFCIKNIRTNNCVIVYAKNCDIIFSIKDQELYIKKGNIAVIEKNLSFDACVKNASEYGSYELYYVKERDLLSLKNIFDTSIPPTVDTYVRKRGINDKIFKINAGMIEHEVFLRLKKNQESRIKRIHSIAYILSKVEDVISLVSSISISTSISFSEKIRRMISKDIKRKWRLSDISALVNLSEISVRKKLEAESTNFYSLLLEVRMNKAIKYLAHTEHHINIIANLIGYSSVSYFIKGFKDVYGITPKQFVIEIKGRKG